MSQRRQHILTIAQTLLHQHGIKKMTISAIAKQADIAVGSVYLEFSSKDDILAALTRQSLDGILRTMRRASMSAQSYDRRVYDIFWGRTTGFLEAAQTHAHLYDLLSCQSCDAVEHLHTSFNAAQRALLTDLLDAAQETEHLSVHDAEQAADVLLMGMWYFDPPHLFSHVTKDLDSTFDRVMTVLLKGLFSPA